jgi:hypothetical protein
MDEVRQFGRDDDQWWIPDDEREFIVAPDDEVPFHVPRD